MDNQLPADIPPKLRHLIHLNGAYRVLICRHNECRKAVQPRSFSEHLRVQHDTPLRDRKQVEEYVRTFKWDYDFSTIELPRDGSRPQPVIPVIDGIQCGMCPSEFNGRPFKSISEKRVRVHGNEEHGLKRVSDDQLFRKVRLQSWFQDHRQRYWVVDESNSEESGDQGVGLREEESTSGLGLREVEAVANSSAEGGNSMVEDIGVVEARDEGVVSVVMDYEVGKEVDDGEEVFSAFDDSGDEDYRESSEDEDVVGENGGGSSAVEVDGSDDGDYEESSGVADDDEEEDSSEVDLSRSEDGAERSSVADDDEEEVIRPVDRRESNPGRERRGRKRKMQSGFEGSGVGSMKADGEAIDSDESTYQDSSPVFQRWGRQRATKRQRRMPRFDDSGVVMGSSQDDGVVRSSSQDDSVVPPSSPPVLGWMIGRRPGSADNRLSVPEPPEVGRRDSGTAQSRLDQLRQRLDRWCQTCPACYLARDFGSETHQMIDCWRDSMVDIIDETVVMQQHIDKFGGFQGRGGCSRCGVPQAICQRWEVSAGGGWGEVPGQQCQYMWTLVPAVVTMIMDGSGEGWSVVQSWMDRAGVTPTSPVEVFEWFREGIWWDNIEDEVARIVRVFHMLVNKNRGLGKT